MRRCPRWHSWFEKRLVIPQTTRNGWESPWRVFTAFLMGDQPREIRQAAKFFREGKWEVLKNSRARWVYRVSFLGVCATSIWCFLVIHLFGFARFWEVSEHGILKSPKNPKRKRWQELVTAWNQSFSEMIFQKAWPMYISSCCKLIVGGLDFRLTHLM